VRLSSDGEHAERISPFLAAGPSGLLAAAWLEQGTRAGDVSEVRFALLTPRGEAAGSERINDVDDQAPRASPSLMVDSGGAAYVAWVDARSGRPEIYAAMRDTDGSWGKNVKLSEGEHEENAAPALAVDAAGNA
jgi:hypothetical protein